MLKKIFSLGSIILLVFAISACGNDEEEEILNPSRGIWEDDTFISEYLGLEFELPEHWSALDDKETAEFFGLVFDDAAPAMGVEIPEEILDALEDGQLHDMFAIHPLGGTNVQIIFERSPLAMLISEEEYIEAAIEEFEELNSMDVGMEFRDFEVASETTTIGNYEWESLSLMMEMGLGIEAASYTFINIQGPNIRQITISILGDETVDDILDAFSTIN